MQTITSTPKISATGTQLVQITDASGNLTNVSTDSVNANIARVGGTTFALGQATMAASMPVVIASNQTNLPANITQLAGAAFSATNYLPNRLTDGTTYYDARQIRALTSADVVTAVQGTAAALSGAWPVKVTDGTNTLPTGDVAARAIFTKTTDGTNTQAVEATPTFAAVGADFIHYLIQQGLYFFGQDYATGIGNGATRDVLFITPAAKVVHVRAAFTTLNGTYTLFEAPTTTANGTAITIYNRNRPSATTASSTMFFTPTVTATGTQLVVISCASSNKSGEFFSADDEIVLKSNTKYLIRFTSGAGSNISSIVLNFYEV